MGSRPNGLPRNGQVACAGHLRRPLVSWRSSWEMYMAFSMIERGGAGFGRGGGMG